MASSWKFCPSINPVPGTVVKEETKVEATGPMPWAICKGLPIWLQYMPRATKENGYVFVHGNVKGLPLRLARQNVKVYGSMADEPEKHPTPCWRHGRACWKFPDVLPCPPWK